MLLWLSRLMPSLSAPVKDVQKVGNGSLKLPLLRGKYFTVYGGPYISRPDKMRGVCLLEDSSKYQASLFLPILDFNIPDRKTAEYIVEQAVQRIVKGEPLYVGCLGGLGRTGLFLALLAKAFGVEKPIGYVRAWYSPRAIETLDQEEFVRKFNVSEKTQNLVLDAKLKSLFRFRENLTNV